MYSIGTGTCTEMHALLYAAAGDAGSWLKKQAGDCARGLKYDGWLIIFFEKKENDFENPNCQNSKIWS